MIDNPYGGTDYQEAWRQGFVAGYIYPHAEHPAPSPLQPEQQTVYAEGVLAGEDTAGQISSEQPAQGTSWTEILHAADIAVEAGHTVHKLIMGSVGAAGAGAIMTFVAIVLAAENEPSLEETAASALHEAQRQLLAEGSVTDNVELFMAACALPGHEAIWDDLLTQRGWWHGRVYQTFDQAVTEALAHPHPEETRVLRFQPAAPDIVEVIDPFTTA